MKKIFLTFYLFVSLTQASFGDWFTGVAAATSIGASVYFGAQYRAQKNLPVLSSDDLDKNYQRCSQLEAELSIDERYSNHLSAASKFQKSDRLNKKISSKMQAQTNNDVRNEQRIVKLKEAREQSLKNMAQIHSTKTSLTISCTSAVIFTGLWFWKYYSK